MRYTNPILPGFHPDPSVCRVGDDFFLVTSTFEYFPGIPIFHSTDLVHWEQIGHVLTKDSQLPLAFGAPNCLGIYAPTIRYDKGTFYCVVTNVGEGGQDDNFFVWTDDPYGEWSEPVHLPFGGIDPSLFFDDDGKIYYSGTDEGIFLAEIVLGENHGLVSAGEKNYVWNGTGANNPEGPHIYKKDGMYYLLLAEGGTEYCHMVTIARSKDIFGSYEPCPDNPILSNRSTGLPIKATGHADLVEDQDGRWWAVCLGIRPLGYPFRHNLGRETMLVPAVWKDGWVSLGEGGKVLEEFDVNLPKSAVQQGEDGQVSFYVPGSDMVDLFQSGTFHPSWATVYNPDSSLYCLTAEGLVMTPNEAGISEDLPKAFLCRRQEHFNFVAEASFCVEGMQDGDEAGISIYMNNRHHYEAALTQMDGTRCLILRRKIGKLEAVEDVVPFTGDYATLVLRGSRESYDFSYKKSHEGMDASAQIGGGEAQYLTTEVGGCFTGNMIALYASKGKHSGEHAFRVKFTRFSYAHTV